MVDERDDTVQASANEAVAVRGKGSEVADSPTVIPPGCSTSCEGHRNAPWGNNRSSLGRAGEGRLEQCDLLRAAGSAETAGNCPPGTLLSQEEFYGPPTRPTWLIAESTGVDACAYIRRFTRNVLAIIRGQECPRHTIFAGGGA